MLELIPEPNLIVPFNGELRVPVKWGTDSGGCGPASESQTQVKVMIREVDRFSQ